MVCGLLILVEHGSVCDLVRLKITHGYHPHLDTLVDPTDAPRNLQNSPVGLADFFGGLIAAHFEEE
jgi:hypothetical protein